MPLDASQCNSDCDARLAATVKLRRDRADTVVHLGGKIYECRDANGNVEMISIEDMLPDFPPAQP